MILMILLTSATLLLDALTKLLAARFLDDTTYVNVIRGVLELRLTRNDGMALGILSGSGVLIVVLPLVVIALGYLLMRRYEMTTFKAVAVSLILGGFLGNFIGRLLNGFVLDMIYFPFLPWFVCNLADIAICAGVVLLGVSLLFRPKDWREVKHEKADSNRDA